VCGEESGDGGVDAAGVVAVAEVLGEGLVVEPVDRAAGLGHLHDVGPGGAAQPDQVLVGVGRCGELGGEGRSQVLPGQAGTEGEGQRGEQVTGTPGVAAEAGLQVGAHRLGRGGRQAGPPSRIGRVGQVRAAGQSSGGDQRNQERPPGRVRDRIGDRVDGLRGRVVPGRAGRRSLPQAALGVGAQAGRVSVLLGVEVDLDRARAEPVEQVAAGAEEQPQAAAGAGVDERAEQPVDQRGCFDDPDRMSIA
jgi:hypothetical protein